MKIKLAKNYGFCFGVQRAIEIAQKHQNAKTVGPLIHNPKEIERLKNQFNIDTLEDASKIDYDDLKSNPQQTFIIRTHGITKDDLSKLKDTSAEIIDATCPYVTKPQRIATKMSQEGYQVIIFGDSEHPEVRGIRSYTQESSPPTIVVKTTKDLEGTKLSKKVAVISQTTKEVKKYLELVTYLGEKVNELRVFNTICNATFENQDAARELAQESEIIVVIGGRNSSNTKQLFDICARTCKHTYLIESKTELESQWFANKETCGITAGASTPKWVIDEVIETIKTF